MSLNGLIKEIDQNYRDFDDESARSSLDVRTQLGANPKVFVESYRNLVSIQAWRAELLNDVLDEDSLDFFIEAQNDFLVSHVMARQGQWRVALQSLRASIEGVIKCIYYKDHQVELTLWKNRKHKIATSELFSYLENHPLVSALSGSLNPIPDLRSEYATLSLAVHGAAANFRMTSGDVPLLWKNSASDLSKWRTRERNVLASINILLLAIFSDHLKSTNKKNLRKSVSVSFPMKKKALVKAQLGIHLYA